MDEQTERNIMRPGDTFVAPECGCSFTVASGPSDENMAVQAPRCCCGHEMVKQGADQNNQNAPELTINDTISNAGAVGDPPVVMGD
jgi:hypothetical protein